ncbi:MAG: hypothetical protein QOJ92_620 [Frankiales bacterium]|nr:hypothetical protein [Frankiales bacterium]
MTRCSRWCLALGALGLLLVGWPPGVAAAAAPPSPCALLTSAEVTAVTGLPVKTPYLFTPANCVWDTPNFADDSSGQPYARVSTIFQPYSGSGLPVLNDQDDAVSAQLGVPASIEVMGPQEGPFPTTRITVMNGLQLATLDYGRCDVADAAGGCSNAKGSTTEGALRLARLMLPRVPFIAPPTDTPGPQPTAPTITQTPPAPAVAGPAGPRHHTRPAVFAAKLPDLRSTFGDASQDLVNLLLAFAVLLFVTFPAELFNKTFEKHYSEIRAGWRRWLHLPPPNGEPRPPRGTSFAAVVLTGAVLGALLDPHAGLDLSTALGLLATLVTIVVFLLLKAGIETGYRRSRQLDGARVLRVLPGGLAVAAACVLFSRLLNFQPGYLYGVVAVVAFSTAMPKQDKGRVSAVSHVAQLVVGLVAWLVWLPVHDAGSTWPVILATDVLGALFVAALVSTTLTLLPLRFLDGGHVFEWRRTVWGALFLTAAFVMLAVMLNPHSDKVRSGPSNWVLAIALLVLFGAASAGFAYYWHRRDARAVAVTP